MWCWFGAYYFRNPYRYFWFVYNATRLINLWKIYISIATLLLLLLLLLQSYWMRSSIWLKCGSKMCRSVGVMVEYFTWYELFGKLALSHRSDRSRQCQTWFGFRVISPSPSQECWKQSRAEHQQNTVTIYSAYNSTMHVIRHGNTKLFNNTICWNPRSHPMQYYYFIHLDYFKVCYYFRTAVLI